MTQIIYKFLDEYLGHGIYLTHNEDRFFYNVFSCDKTLILTFRVKDNWDNIKLFRSEPLCKTVSSLFCITTDEASKFISNWFGEIHNLKRVGDLKKLVPELSES